MFSAKFKRQITSNICHMTTFDSWVSRWLYTELDAELGGQFSDLCKEWGCPSSDPSYIKSYGSLNTVAPRIQASCLTRSSSPLDTPKTRLEDLFVHSPWPRLQSLSSLLQKKKLTPEPSWKWSQTWSWSCSWSVCRTVNYNVKLSCIFLIGRVQRGNLMFIFGLVTNQNYLSCYCSAVLRFSFECAE